MVNLQSWIDVDLQPWKSTGITKKMADLGAQQGMRASRIQIIDGKVYAQISKSSRGPFRIWYWLWGLLELIDKFPAEDIPNVDLILNTQDDPQVLVVGFLSFANGFLSFSCSFGLGCRFPFPFLRFGL